MPRGTLGKGAFRAHARERARRPGLDTGARARHPESFRLRVRARPCKPPINRGQTKAKPKRNQSETEVRRKQKQGGYDGAEERLCRLLSHILEHPPFTSASQGRYQPCHPQGHERRPPREGDRCSLLLQQNRPLLALLAPDAPHLATGGYSAQKWRFRES